MSIKMLGSKFGTKNYTTQQAQIKSRVRRLLAAQTDLTEDEKRRYKRLLILELGSHICLRKVGGR